ncbi:exosortase/archaeosortase family protein [Candidatus Woesearchaeota archaeon]|nr:exosortase/archaeosortase family protein [Candidatus Woesearchaeota archaeon]
MEKIIRTKFLLLGLFLIIIGVAIPVLLYVLTPFFATDFEYHFFSFPAYTLMLLAGYIIYNRVVLRGVDITTQWRSRMLYMLGALCCLGVYIFVRVQYEITNATWGSFVVLFVLLYGLMSLFIACVLFGTRFLEKTYHSLFIIAIIGYLYYLITTILWAFWEPLAITASRVAIWILHFFFDTATMSMTGTSPQLQVNSFSVIIGPPCSGVESLSMFIGLAILLFVYEHDTIHMKRGLLAVIIGLLGSFFLNIIRIAGILAIGTFNPDVALGLFHSHAGWILFSAFVLLLLWVLYPWIHIKKNMSHR